MKVNVVTPWNVKCGNADYAKGLIEGLKKRVDVRVIEIEQPYTANPFHFLSLGKKAGKDCDIVHVQHGYGVFGKLFVSGIFSPLFYRQLTGKRVVTTLHDVYDVGGVLGFFRRLINRSIFRRSDILHVHSQKAADLLKEQGVGEEKIVVSPLAIFQKPVRMDKKTCQKQLGVEGKVLLLFGFIQRNKGYERVIDALPSLGKNTTILIAGHPFDKGYVRELKRLAQERGVQDRVVFKEGFQDDEISTILGAVDVGVLPYKDITQSSVLSYFIAQKIPVVTSDIPFFRELKEEFGCVAVAREGQYEKNIASLLANTPIRKRLLANVNRFFTSSQVESVTEELKSMYRRLI